MEGARVAASWSQGKLSDQRPKQKRKRGLDVVSWCYECRALKPNITNGLCRKHYMGWRKRQPHMRGHCGTCDPDAKGKPKPLHILDPPICLACYETRRREELRRTDPAAVKAMHKKGYAARRNIPGYLESKRAYRERMYAEDEGYRAREIARGRGRYRPVADLTPEEAEALRAHRRALYAARQAPGYVKPVRKVYTPAPAVKPTPLVRRRYARKLTAEEATVFGGAIAALREEVRPSKVFRRRKAA